MANKPAVDVNAVVAAVLAAMGQTAQVAVPVATVAKAAKAAPAPANIAGIADAVSKGTVEVRQSVKGKAYAVVKFSYGDRQQVVNVWL